MSQLFRKRSLQQNIDRFDELRAIAKRQGLALTVQNVSSRRNLPVFIFTLAGQGSIPIARSHNMDEIAVKLEGGSND